MNETRQRNLRAWVLVIGVLVVIAWVSFTLVGLARQSANQARQIAQPVADLSKNVGTQIAQVLHPTPTVMVDPVTIVRQVRSLARLETIQYTIEKVITAESNQGPLGFLFGDKLILVAHGVVVAGIDLQKIGPEDMWVQDNVLYVRLPDPEIFIATLDNQKSYIYNRDTGVFTKGNINLETAARQQAEQAIRQAAIDDGILNQASQNGQNYLYRLLLDLGHYSEVIFVQETPAP